MFYDPSEETEEEYRIARSAMIDRAISARNLIGEYMGKENLDLIIRLLICAYGERDEHATKFLDFVGIKEIDMVALDEDLNYFKSLYDEEYLKSLDFDTDDSYCYY